ncbi:Sortilin- receptor [Desmophyllum pertusum]|uniref:Sortilin- receptor n=1 Tax=Desmophyllum pertusum TaxID=174260 RepID=A0A9W9ZNX7_9CNID|nr:Sortilin- receptor [Desmophyllum pertusum]
MEIDVRKVVVLLACFLLPASGRIQEDAAEDAAKASRVRHLLCKGTNHCQALRKSCSKIEHEEPSRSSGGQNVHELFRRVRRSLNPDMKPDATVFQLNDSHFMAYVHWAGDHRDTIVVLTRDRNPGLHIDNTKYLFVDVRNRLIFSTRDDCSTFVKSSPPFKPR